MKCCQPISGISPPHYIPDCHTPFSPLPAPTPSPFAPPITAHELMSITSAPAAPAASVPIPAPTPIHSCIAASRAKASRGNVATFLENNMGKAVRIEFYMGCEIIEKCGIIREVGENHVVLEVNDRSGLVMCELVDARFISIV